MDFDFEAPYWLFVCFYCTLGHLKQFAEIAKGSGVPNKEKVGTVTAENVRKIAETKIKDLNAHDLEAAQEIIRGTARSMGVTIEE